MSYSERDAVPDEDYALIMRQGDLLTRTVNALKGDPPPDTLWSHHDAPELAAALRDERDTLLMDKWDREALIAQRDRLREALVDALMQGCADEGGEFDSCALSAFADGLRLLAELGLFTIKEQAGRRVIGRFTDAALARVLAETEPRGTT